MFKKSNNFHRNLVLILNGEKFILLDASALCISKVINLYDDLPELLKPPINIAVLVISEYFQLMLHLRKKHNN